ncbi:MAG: metallophosphoesterase [Candidatus Moranbacteria bacterium]|nr:metallophosphoesterase [Candidatus Moranbacteria bacterium]
MSHFEGFQSVESLRKPHPLPVERVRYERESQVERVICLSDIHNDLIAAQASLEQRGIVHHDGEWRRSVKVHLIITGDSINKQEPNPEVLKYFAHLRKTAPPGCSVTMLAGNHEIDVLLRAADGEKVGLKDGRIEFLGSMDIICKRGPVLYLHRYPSLGLVQELWRQYRMQGGDPDTWDINQRFHEAVATMRQSPEQSKAVFRECDDGGDKQALAGLSAEEYYQKYSALIGQYLNEMGVTTVVHGHKIQKEGGQKFEQYIPGVFMVNIDAGISSDKNPEHRHRIGSIEVAPDFDGGIEITCAYKPNINRKKGDAQVRTITVH